MKKITISELEKLGVISPRPGGPIRFKPDTPISEIAKSFEENHIGSVPIVDDNDFHVGVLSERDMAIKLVAQGRDSDLVVAKEIMRSGDIARAKETDTINYAIEQIKSRGARHVTIVDEEGKVINFLSYKDFFLATQKEMKNLKKKQLQMVRLQILIPIILVITAISAFSFSFLDEKYIVGIVSAALLAIGIATVLTAKKNISYENEEA